MIAAGIYTLLLKYQSRQAALAFAFYLVLGSWATAAGRFDLIPAGLTLGAVILATEARWKWAFALLALATLYKFYPVILAVPFLLAQQMHYKNQRWLSWKRWSALSIFIGMGALITLISLFLLILGITCTLLLWYNRRQIGKATPQAGELLVKLAGREK